MRVVIVGGGIGGLATALALSARGLDCVVLEQAPELREVGAGIQLSPNGVRVPQALGLGGALASFSVEPGAHRFLDWQTGELLIELPLCPQTQKRFEFPYLHAHRRLARQTGGGFSPQQEWLYAYDAEKAARGEDSEWRQLSWLGAK